MNSTLYELKKGLLIVLSGPSAAGKTLLMKRLLQEFSCIARSIPYTTRKPRTGEVPGFDYHFISVQEFQERSAKGEFLLNNRLVFGNYYGDSRKDIEEKQKSGKHIILIINPQGAIEHLMGRFEAVFIFISPPNLAELRRRLGNHLATKEEIEIRFAAAEKEMELMKHFPRHVVNQDLDGAYDRLRSILIAETASSL